MKLLAGEPQMGTLDDKLPAGYASRPQTRPVGGLCRHGAAPARWHCAI